MNRDHPGTGVLATLRGKIGPALIGLWSSPKLLDVAEQLIGPDVDGHPNWVLRAKTPETRLLLTDAGFDIDYQWQPGRGKSVFTSVFIVAKKADESP